MDHSFVLLGDTEAVSAHVKLGEQIGVGGQYSHYLYYTILTVLSLLF